MKLGEGVEHAIHSVALLADLKPGSVLPAAALAEFHGVSPSYLLKHLQALSGAGILATVPGPKLTMQAKRSPRANARTDSVEGIHRKPPSPDHGAARRRRRAVR